MDKLELHEGRGGIWFDYSANPGKPLVIFRTDIDALKIQETNDVPYRSQVPGIMHACGHDCHTAMLLTAMREIIELDQKTPGSLPNNIRFVFQRAEESGALATNSGGCAMVTEDGVTKGADAALALHVASISSSGIFFTRPGSFFASTSRLELTIKTRGGHAGMPSLAENALGKSSKLICLARI